MEILHLILALVSVILWGAEIGSSTNVERLRQTWDSDVQIFLDAPRALDVLSSSTRSGRQKRGLGSTIHGWTNGEENRRRMEESIEHDKRIYRITKGYACRSRCLTDWSEWSICSKPCNDGTRVRTRAVSKPEDCAEYSCPGSLSHVQRCHLDCGPGGTTNDNGQCECRDGFSGQCCEKSITCPKLPKPSNGDLCVLWPALYGAGAVYSCNPGYTLVGGEEVRRCQLNGKWSGTAGYCSRVECDGLPIPEHGSIFSDLGDGIFYGGESIAFKCDLGFEMKGSAVRTCKADRNGTVYWSGAQPECIERVCGDPGTPRNGMKQGDGQEFGDAVTFSCNSGFTLIGSKERTCLYNARWSGTQPTCQQIVCAPLEPPENGFLTFEDQRGSTMGSVVSVECRKGYELDGASIIACQDDGQWNATMPSCGAIECSDPGSPEHGSRLDNGFAFGSKVKYSCFDGYVLWGSSESQCLKSRVWSDSRPTCRACPKDHYSFRLSSGESQCQLCPLHSHTASNGSYSLSQCECDEGYAKNGEECEEIHCPALSAPTGGVLYPCDTKSGSMCITECINGHVLTAGAAVRYCLESGQWSGSTAVCSKCPKNTFRGTPANCFPCPVHSHTIGTGSSFTDCICDDGFSGPGGGPCLDIDECLIGVGQCEDVCHNTYGGYACECTRPGVIVDKDGLSCRVENECRNLTTSDAPQNGGLVCHWYTEESSQFCKVMCNEGFELPPETNSFETCGPTTQYIWSYQVTNMSNTLLPCIDEFFPGYKLYSETSYFVRACSALSELEKDEVKRNFAYLLNSQKICQHGRTKLCEVDDMGIICGATGRKRRSTDDEDPLEIVVTLKARQTIQKSVDCSKFCPKFRLVGENCEKYCIKTYNRFLRAGMLYAQRKMKAVGRRASQLLSFNAAGRQFSASRISRVSDVEADCPTGTLTSGDMCVPCGPGTYFANVHPNGTLGPFCVKCEEGSYQSEYQQESCLPCPIGSTSAEGSSECTPCDGNHYGENCQFTCGCSNGDCNSVDGSCSCDPGWEGTACDVDIDGCATDPCFQDVQCVDLEAPLTGFECGECPNGYIGDGIVCEESV